MISSISIQNFQSHRHSEMEFSNGVSIITGQSDSGKSSIIRALLWVFNNRPAGEAIRNWKAQERDKTKVSVTFNTTTITKERYKGKSKYIVNGVEFEAIKQEVPEEVSLTTNLSDCNVQTQHEPYFLLNETPGEVARRLNEIVGLDIIDTIFKNLDRRIRNVSSSAKIYDETIKTLIDEIKSIEYADKLYEEVSLLQEKQHYPNNLEKSISQMKMLHDQTTKINIELTEQKALLKAESHMTALISKIDDYKLLEKEHDNLKRIANDLNGIENVIKSEKEWLECEPVYSKLITLISDFMNFETSLKHLKELASKITNLDTTRLEEEYAQKSLIEEYSAKLSELKVCPVCFTSISSNRVKAIVEQLYETCNPR